MLGIVYTERSTALFEVVEQGPGRARATDNEESSNETISCLWWSDGSVTCGEEECETELDREEEGTCGVELSEWEAEQLQGDTSSNGGTEK